jgi:FtsP/CotA-like multicopper oxidase with cupredoxin domain
MFLLLSALAATAVAGSALAQSCISDPPTLSFSSPLEFGAHTFDYGSDGTFTTYAYKQGSQWFWPGAGPTINMSPGQSHTITLKNLLASAPLSTQHNVFKDSQATNLHTHGLHISGELPGDDVTRVVNGQRLQVRH